MNEKDYKNGDIIQFTNDIYGFVLLHDNKKHTVTYVGRKFSGTGWDYLKDMAYTVEKVYRVKYNFYFQYMFKIDELLKNCFVVYEAPKEEKVLEVTMADLEAKYGCVVKVVK